MNLAVIAPAYYPDDRPTKLLRDSCAIHHLPLYPFGVGQPWQGDAYAHFTGARDAILNLPSIYELIMFTDAGDTFVMGGAEEIEMKFQEYECDVLMSAEMDLYPWGLEEQWSTSPNRPITEPPWQYPNGGGWVGRRDTLVKLLEFARTAGGDEAQSKWISTYCSGVFKMRLDDRCSIFQTMSNNGPSLFVKRRLYNRATNTYPVVMHFNGKLGGIEKAWEQVYGTG